LGLLLAVAILIKPGKTTLFNSLNKNLMTPFSITTRISTKEYSRFMLTGIYKKPAFILATTIGMYYAITLALHYLDIIEWYNGTPVFEICLGTFLLLAPLLIVFISVQQFKSNPSFQNDMNFTFSEDSYRVEGLTFKSEFSWNHIIKQKEVGRFLILYHNKRLGNFIDKTKLTEEQLQFIKSKVAQK